MLRRKLGNAVQKAVQTHDLPLYAADTGEIEGVAVQTARHLAALHERHHIVRDTGVKVASRVAQTRRVLDEHERVFRQIIERSRYFRVNKRHILVRRRERAALAQTFRIALQIFLKLGVLLLAAGGNKRQHRFRKSCRAALRECRNGFHARQAAQRVALLQTPLTADVEGRNRVDLIVPELHAVRVRRLRRKNVQNAAAHRELARALDLRTALVAGADQTARQLIERCALPRRQRNDRRAQQLGRHGALRRRLHGRDRESRAGERRERGKTCLLVAARHTGHVRHDQLTGRQNHDLALGKAAQVGGKAVRGVVIVRQHQNRALQVCAERRGEVRLVDGRESDRQHRRFPLFERFLQPFVFIQECYTFCNLRHAFTSRERVYKLLSENPCACRRAGCPQPAVLNGLHGFTAAG